MFLHPPLQTLLSAESGGRQAFMHAGRTRATIATQSARKVRALPHAKAKQNGLPFIQVCKIAMNHCRLDLVSRLLSTEHSEPPEMPEALSIQVTCCTTFECVCC
jgi:hypothetical protein